MYVLTKDYKVIQPWELGGIDYIKYAQTVEELCDIFIKVEYKDNICNCANVLGYDFEQSFEQARNSALYDGYVVYGATYTNEGFKFVAKFNDKGELELR